MSTEDNALFLNRRRLIQTGFAAGAALAASRLDPVGSAKAADDAPSLAGKRIAISATGTDHYWDLKAYQAQIDEVKRLGGEPIGLDAGRDDKKLVAQLQTLIGSAARRGDPDAWNAERHRPLAEEDRGRRDPRLHRRCADDEFASTTLLRDNFGIGSSLALRLVSDIGGEGNIVVFNGFYGVTVCAIRYDELKHVLKYYPKVKIIQPELRDVIPNTVQDAFAQITAHTRANIRRRARSRRSGLLGTCRSSAPRRRSSRPGARKSAPMVSMAAPRSIELVKDPKSPAAAVAAQQPAPDRQDGRPERRSLSRRPRPTLLRKEILGISEAILATKDNAPLKSTE